MEIRADPNRRADCFVERWQDSIGPASASIRRVGYKATRSAMGDMAKSLERDPRLESILLGRKRFEVRKNQLVVQLKRNDADEGIAEDDPTVIIPWTKPQSRMARSILQPTSANLPLRPMKLERRATLVAAIACGRRWLDELVADSATDAQAIARREHCSLRHINMTLSPAFLSPTLVKATVEGRLPRGVGVEQLRDLPQEWDHQFEALGLSLA